MKKIFIPIVLTFLACGGAKENPQEKQMDSAGQQQAGIPQGDTLMARDLSFTQNLQTGDIVFVNCNSSLGLPISLATHSQYTHCGMFYRQGERAYVIESSDTSKIMPVGEFFDNTADTRVLALRLKSAKNGFDNRLLKKLETVKDKWLGHFYDGQFMWDDEKLYCSELVYKIYADMGIKLCPLKKIRDFDFSSPQVKEEIELRFDGKIPYEEPVVAPIDLVHSNLLDTVYYSK